MTQSTNPYAPNYFPAAPSMNASNVGSGSTGGTLDPNNPGYTLSNTPGAFGNVDTGPFGEYNPTTGTYQAPTNVNPSTGQIISPNANGPFNPTMGGSTDGGFATNGGSFQFGGMATGANQAMQQMQGLGAAGNAQLSGAASGLLQGQTSQINPQAMAQLYAQASGAMPSAAQTQSQQSLQQSMDAQNALALSARGPAALASAGYNRAANLAGLMQSGASQNQALGAQGQAASTAAYANAQQGQAATNLQAQQAGLQGMSQGNALNQSYQGLSAGISQQQLQAYINQQQQQSQNFAYKAGQQFTSNQANQQVTNNQISTGLGALTGTISAAQTASQQAAAAQAAANAQNGASR